MILYTDCCTLLFMFYCIFKFFGQLYCTIFYCFYYTVHNVSYCILFFCVILNSIALCCVQFYYIVLYRFVLYSILLYCVYVTAWSTVADLPGRQLPAEGGHSEAVRVLHSHQGALTMG